MSKKKRTVATLVNDPLKYVREFAPSLTVARASLLPFEDLICAESAGPQNGDPDEPYFAVTIDTKEYGEDFQVEARVTADTVTMSVYGIDFDEDGEPLGQVEVDSWRCSLKSLWEYLRQLPRPARSFR